MRRWDSIVSKYSEFMKGQDLSEATIACRVSEIGKFGLNLKTRRPIPVIEDLKEEHFSFYLKSRTKFKSKPTTRAIMSHLRCFGDFLARENMLVRNPMRWLHGPKVSMFNKAPKRISKEDMLKLWVEATKNLNNLNQHMLVVVLSVLYGTGLRRGELERLCIDDFLEEEKYLILDGKKSRKERQIYLPPDVYSLIETYLPFRQNALHKNDKSSERHLFVNSKGDPITGQSISLKIKRLAKKAGIEKINMHQFRHTCASDLLGAGFRIDQVKDILGHASVSATMRYFHISAPERKDAMGKHPINDMLKNINSEES